MNSEMIDEIKTCLDFICDSFVTLEFAHMNANDIQSGELVSIINTATRSGMSAHERLKAALDSLSTNSQA